MKNLRHMLFLIGCAGMFAATGARAGNLIQNPYFEDRLNLWEHDPPGQVTWTNTMDYSVADSGVPGAMVLDGTIGPAVGFQCVTVLDSVDYVASMRVQSHCPGQTLNVFFTDAGCTAGASFVSAASTRVDEWELITVFAHPTPGAQRALVVAENPGGCADNPAYVDDVFFGTDIIFANGFEPPTPP